MSLKKIIFTNILVLVLLFLLFSFSNPESSNLIASTAALILIYAFSSSLVLIIIKIAYDEQFNNRKKLVISMVLGSILPMILAISSLSKLSMLDIVLIISVPLAVIWYIQKKGIL